MSLCGVLHLVYYVNMQSVFMLNVFRRSVIMLSVIMLNVIMLNVMAPLRHHNIKTDPKKQGTLTEEEGSVQLTSILI